MKFMAMIVAAIEWYDTAICISLASVMSALFFPTSDMRIRFLLYFLSFAIGYLGRPLGAFLFGLYSDKRSRLKAATYSFALMIFSSLFISFLPTYASIGFFAPLLFVILRFLQGIALGGNYGVNVFSVESTHKAERNFVSSIICVGFMLGFLFGGLAASALTYFCTPEFLSTIGWRLGLWSCFVLSIPVLIKFNRADEYIKEHADLIVENERISLPLLAKIFFLVLALDMIPFYMFFMFAPNYKVMFLSSNSSLTWLYNSLAMITMIICTPAFGKLADAYSSQRTLTWAAVLLCLISFFAPWSHWLWSVVLGAIMALCYGGLYAFISMIFPKNIRATACGLLVNVASVFNAAFLPLIATFLYGYSFYLLGAFLFVCSATVPLILNTLKEQ